jgi:hypothetical protein
MSNAADKIAKWLALAESPVEAEAKAALLKARQLMAESKLRPEDISPQENKRLIQAPVGVTSTKLMTPWAAALASVVAKHYCCGTFLRRQKGRKTAEIGFIGLEDDFNSCKLAFRYAYDSVMARCKEIRKQYQDEYPVTVIRQMCHSYGWGFCRGLSAAFEAQSQEHQEWGLVMTVPKAVEDILAPMKKSAYAKPRKSQWDKQFAAMGYADGQKFDTSRRLGTA